MDMMMHVPFHICLQMQIKGSESGIEWKLILILLSWRNQLSTQNDAPKTRCMQFRYEKEVIKQGKGGLLVNTLYKE